MRGRGSAVPEDHDLARLGPARSHESRARGSSTIVIDRATRRCRIVADVAQLYEELAPRLRSIVLRDVNAPAAVIEDACQFAWYRLVRHAERIERQGALSWLARTAVHEAIKVARRDQRELSLEARADDNGELNIASPNPATGAGRVAGPA